MSSLFSAISGQFSKALILGAFLPVTIFAFLFQLFVVPLFPTDLPLLRLFEQLGAEWRLVSVLFVIIVLSGLLYNLNTVLIRVYEGYPWQETAFGQQRVRSYQAELDAAISTRLRMRMLANKIRDLNGWEIFSPHFEVGREYLPAIGEKQRRAGEQINSEFPQRSSVLPTRLGNVIRSFENYPRLRYGMSAIPLWPRLIAKIDKDYAAAMDDAKTSFDFILNCSALSGALALTIFGVGLFYAFPLTILSLCASWLLTIAVFAMLAYSFYVGAINRAHAWGGTVKGAFDLYRWALLEQLGFKRVPTTMAEERALWETISLHILFGDPPSGRLIEYATTSAYAQGEPSRVELALTRAVELFSPPGPTMTIRLSVKNVDPQQRMARRVIVTDTVPEGFEYLADSETGWSPAVEVTGSNPYRFEVGDIAYNQTITLTYQVVPRRKGDQ